MITIVFGDSIAWGAFDFKEGGWVERLKKFNFGTDTFVYNCSISGNTSTDVIKRFKKEVEARADNDTLNIIFAIGINDASRIKGKNRTPIFQFEKNIEKLISMARLYTHKARIFFVGLTQVKEGDCTPVAWDNKLTYQNRDIYAYQDALYNKVCKKLGKENFIFAAPDKSHIIDGVHLTAAWHKNMFETVISVLTQPKLTQEDF